MTDVAAALVRKDDTFMICRRPPHKTRGLLWEFVGGKVEKGETAQEALVRECREELGITVSVDDLFMELVHEYPDITVHLLLFNARITQGEPKLLEHVDLKWISPSQIDDFEFCPADEEILLRLKQNF